MITAKVKYPRIDLPAVQAAVDERMKSFTLDAMAVWVRSATTVIPVWSGASRASFLKLARQVSLTIPIQPVAPIGSRIPLGIETSTGSIIADQAAGLYGWQWSSGLDYIGIVDIRVGFLDAAISATRKLSPELPPLEFRE
jgi:hypothetical protein